MRQWVETAERYRAVGARQVQQDPRFQGLPADVRRGVDVLSHVLPFRTNSYVLDLVDWAAAPDDPIFQLTFPQEGMLAAEEFRGLGELLDRGANAAEIRRDVDAIRRRMNPHPAGQRTHNVPKLSGRPLEGLQHKYRETVLYFPAQGQTCHAYCTYCFRWPQFVGMADLKFEARASDDLQVYLATHDEVTDLLVTGGDPMIMKTAALRSHFEPLLSPAYEHLRSIRFGSKSLAYWPQRFVTDSDADDLLRFFEQIIASGRHVAFMAHFSHLRELASPIVRQAIVRLRAAGAEIRMQAPLVRRVNDDPGVWAEMWRTGVQLGLVPYYMFVERDTGPKNYFEVPLARAYQIYRGAYEQVSGLARTVRGPSMSALPGKVRLLGVQTIQGERVFVLDFIQARNPHWVRRPFFAKFSRRATWFDQLEPAFGETRFFFDGVRERTPEERRLLALPVAS